MTLLLFEGTASGSGSSVATYQRIGRQMGISQAIGGAVSWLRIKEALAYRG